eukprot:CAMPEP_0205887534 /NCGR_PEP_ID=MMETSP1083-20121108/19874_1 /ASSEMBLY_ACC=CAM_ASM_000430 /TAXON_ID=97485 /ORGANISM="Prymnesium parvum, Strain Texoma1" /LENGTH=124 /DNA_ID=CAMNT_0053251351 /DNA_START=69 /DNA_END=443 /DNA_ORIENTATION=-
MHGTMRCIELRGGCARRDASLLEHRQMMDALGGYATLSCADIRSLPPLLFSPEGLRRLLLNFHGCHYAAVTELLQQGKSRLVQGVLAVRRTMEHVVARTRPAPPTTCAVESSPAHSGQGAIVLE